MNDNAEIAGLPAYKRAAVAALVPYARNSRTHSAAQVDKIAASIREFGFLNPVITDGANGIIAGHGRILAAQKLGIDEVPTIDAAHLTDAQRRAYIIADNRLALDAGWDEEMLRVEIGDLKDAGFDLALTGFNLDEISALMADDATVGLTDEDAVPDAPEVPTTVLGDVWMLGRHRLMCGDSTSIDAVDRLMDGRKADAVITDPPYNQETGGGFKGKNGENFDGLKRQSAAIEHMCDFDPLKTLPIIAMVHSKGKMNATIFCNKDLVPDYLSWARECGYSFNILIWKKPSAIPLGGTYIPDVEYCLVFRKSGKFNTRIEGVSYSKVLVHGRETGLHPTMKPVGMLENQIKIVSDQGDILADLFGGSGSTLIACEKTARDCRMMELDPKYCDVIITRWQDFTGLAATLEGSGQTYAEVTSNGRS
jgi:DNA modification methylase